MPEGANPDKVEATRSFGASVEFYGKDYDEARLWVEEEAKRKGYRYIHSANEPLLIAGVGTLYLEIMEEIPDIDVIIVPIGGGSGAAAACTVAKDHKSKGQGDRSSSGKSSCSLSFLEKQPTDGN